MVLVDFVSYLFTTLFSLLALLSHCVFLGFWDAAGQQGGIQGRVGGPGGD